MKKQINLLLTFTMLSSATLNTIGCQLIFNNQTKVNDIANNKFAEQAAKVVEGFFFAYTRDADTEQTINDMLTEVDNLSIDNRNIGPINNMADFKKYWGEDGNITFTGFEENEDNLIVSSKKGTLTKEINKYQDQNQQLHQVDNYISFAKVIDSSILSGLIKKIWPEIDKYLKIFHQKYQKKIAEQKQAKIDFLTAVQNLTTNNMLEITKFLEKKAQLHESKLKTLKIINDKIKNPDSSIINDADIKTISDFFMKIKALDTPGWFGRGRTLTFLNQIDGLNAKMVAILAVTPQNPLQTYLINDTDLLSNLKYFFYGIIPPLDGDIIANYQNFNDDEKYAYAGGHILNRLFARISEENHLKKDKDAQFVKRNLTDIINDIGRKDVSSKFKTTESDFKQYGEKIFQNPSYMIELVAALTPLIKHLILNNTNSNNKISTTIKYLTLDYDDITNDTYSIKTMLTNLQSWTNNDLKPLANLLNNIGKQQNIGPLQFFLSDIMEKVSHWKPFLDFAFSLLVDWLVTIIKPVLAQFQEIVTNMQTVIKIASDKNKKLKISIDSLITQLAGENQLFTYLHQFVSELGQKLINYNMTFSDFSNLLGISNGTFKKNSLLWFIDTCLMKNNNSFLNNIFLLLIGNNKDGLLHNVIDYNRNLIKQKYKKYFSANNKALSKIYHLKSESKTVGAMNIDDLQFNLNYTLDDKTFYFRIKCTSKYDPKNNPGLRILQFREISKLKAEPAR